MDSDNDVYYKIVWTRNQALTVAEMQWFDEYDYNLASNQKFSNEREAILAAQKLAFENDVDCECTLYGMILDND